LGTDYADSWQQGFVVGFLDPDSEHTAPTSLQPDQGRVYEEGVLAGEDTSSQGLTLPSVPPAEDSFGEIITEGVHIADLGHTAFEVVKKGLTLASAAEAVVFFFAWQAILGPNRSVFD
jgi:hypothetical protein